MPIPGIFAQNSVQIETSRWNSDKSIPYYIKLGGSLPDSATGLSYIKETYKLKEKYSLHPHQVLNEELGYRHIRYQIEYNNTPITGSVIIAHFLNGKLHSFNGDHYGTGDFTLSPTLNEEQCLQFALSHINAESYMWESEGEEALLKEIMEDESATYYPSGELVYCAPGAKPVAADIKLAYKFNIYASKPHSRKDIYIDATNGTVIMEDDLIHFGDVKGTAVTRYSGTQTITTDSTSPTNYRLRQVTHGKGIETYNMKNGTSYNNAVDFTDSNNYWNNVNAAQDEVATDAHWGAEMTYKYFWNVHGRKSFDNNDAKIRSYVHRGTNYNNAFWNGAVMTYGDGDGTRFTPLVCIDVCGHEIAHAVTTNSAGLVYRFESGALNESFSDIFGNAIERYAKPTGYSYKIGEDIVPNGSGLRNMANPKIKRDPDTYKGQYWYTGTGDNGGVHTNSGVQNYWYYILSEGAAERNDNNDSFNISGLGYEKAAKIAYRNLTVYLSRNSNHADARFYAIRSAIDLYGDCSDEMIQTTNAWYGVGVGPEYDTAVVADFQAAPPIVCFTTDTIQFQNLSVNAASYRWFFGDGDSANVRNPKHAYKNYGQFTVTLIAGNCNGYAFDTVSYTNYITVDSSRIICKADLMPITGTGPVITKCKGYLMDNGGDDVYLTRVTTIRTIAPLNATRIDLEFLQFRMENGYDSLYVYDGTDVNSPLLGGYTGFSLPPNLSATSGAVTFKHFADPYVVDSGFIVKWTTVKPSLAITAPNDTTICKHDTLDLVASGTGGGGPTEYEYYWTEDNILADTFAFSPLNDTILRVILKDFCMNTFDTAYVNIKVNQELQVDLTPDSTICYGQSIDLIATASGGDPSNYTLTWNQGLGTGTQKTVSPTDTTLYYVVLSDGCSAANDTAFSIVNVRDSLSLSVTADTLICNGNQVNLLATASGGLATGYQFNWDNSLGNGNSKFVTPTVSTSYTVILSDGCTDPSQSRTIQVDVLDSLNIALFKDTTICIGQSINLFTTATGGLSSAYTIAWNNGLSDGPSNVVSPGTTTTYVVNLTDGCSVAASLDSATVTVRERLRIFPLVDSTICYGQSIDLFGEALGGDKANYEFRWDNGLGIGDSKTVSPTTTTTYQVIVSDGCTVKEDTTSAKVTVLPALAMTKSNDTSICVGETVNLMVSGMGGKTSNHTFNWNNGLGAGNAFAVSPTTTTTYVITFDDGCSNQLEDSIVVTVIQNPVVGFTADKYILCTGDSVQFTDTTNGIIATEFNWTFGTEGNSSLQNPVFTFKNTGLFDITLYLKNNSGCEGSATKPKYIEVIPAPVSSFTFAPITPDYFNSNVSFTSTSQNADFYFWNFGNGVTSTNQSHSVQYGDTGSYYVSLEVSNNIGCVSISTQEVRIKDVFKLHIPNAFTPNNDNVNDFFRPQGRGVIIYSMTIYNRWGEQVFSTNDMSIPWTGAYNNEGDILQNGTYMYILEILDVDNYKKYIEGTVLLLK
jgi:gliding motility-associated-like protein